MGDYTTEEFSLALEFQLHAITLQHAAGGEVAEALVSFLIRTYSENLSLGLLAIDNVAFPPRHEIIKSFR